MMPWILVALHGLSSAAPEIWTMANPDLKIAKRRVIS